MDNLEHEGLFRLRVLDETTSTNDEIKRAIEAGEPEGLAIRALRQTAGHGRQGRTWASPVGGMYVSCLLRPSVSDDRLPTLSLAAALGVRRAVVDLIGPQAHITVKWPNDLVCSAVADATAESRGATENSDKAENTDATAETNPEKLCGISLEAHAGGVCVGIGMNVFASGGDSTAMPKEGICLEDLMCSGKETPSVSQVCSAVLKEFSDVYKTWLTQGFKAFVSEYEAHAWLTSRYVSVENVDGSGAARGIVQGIDGQGRLLIRLSDSDHVRAFSSGEVHVADIGLPSTPSRFS